MTPAEIAAGLDRPLPPGERILWQGAPDRRAMARGLFHLGWVAAYFLVTGTIVALIAMRGGRPPGQAIAEATLLLPFAAIGCALLWTIGRMTAKHSVYTLTNRRLILHIGIAYEMTVSVPLSAIADASVRTRDGGRGDIALRVRERSDASYVALWPHARAWRLRDPQPMLRAVPDVEAACEAIGDALVAFNAGGRARPLPVLAAEAVAA